MFHVKPRSVTIIDLFDEELPRWDLLGLLRKRRNISAQEVADKAGISRGQVYYVEAADVTTMRLDILARHIEALGGRLNVTVEFDDQETEKKEQ